MASSKWQVASSKWQVANSKLEEKGDPSPACKERMLAVKNTA